MRTFSKYLILLSVVCFTVLVVWRVNVYVENTIETVRRGEAIMERAYPQYKPRSVEDSLRDEIIQLKHREATLIGWIEGQSGMLQHKDSIIEEYAKRYKAPKR